MRSYLFYLIFTHLLFLSSNGIGQQYYNQSPEFLNANIHWALGQGTGLEFTSGTAAPFQTSIILSEGSAAVSDRTTGDLLFYTNGGSVWNANHVLMPNGIGLMGNSYGYSALQGTLIVPFVEDSNKYYIFSLPYEGNLDFDPNSGKKGSLFYSVVDMTLDNFNGDVDTNHKNIVLDTSSLSEAMLAIPGCNNDIWLLVHSFDQSPPEYKAYHISKNGVNHIPIISRSLLYVDYVASMTVSPDRKKIAFISWPFGAELSKFDAVSGIVDNSLQLISKYDSSYEVSIDTDGPMSAAFSPDNSKLYITEVTPGAFNVPGRLSQYDVSYFDSISIASSQLQVYNGNGRPYGIRLYNDTIYTSEAFQFQGTPVHRINRPNNSDTACDFQLNAIPNIGDHIYGTLGSEVVFAISTDTLLTVLDTTVCEGWENGIYITATDTFSPYYMWSTGETASSIKIEDEGLYWVRYSKCNEFHIDTFIVRGSILFPTITIQDFELGVTGGPFESYQWYFNGEAIPGAIYSVYQIHANGDYLVEVSNEYGCTYMSDVYKVDNYTSIADLTLLKNMIKIYPNPAMDNIDIMSPIAIKASIVSLDGKTLLKTGVTSSISLNKLAAGLYMIYIYDQQGVLLKVEKLIKKSK